MKVKIIMVIFFCVCFTKNNFSQEHSRNKQGIKRSSMWSIEKIKREPLSFIIGGISVHPSQTSGYGMINYVKRFGFYGKVKTNLRFNDDYDYNVTNSYEELYATKRKKGRYSFSGGLLYRVNNPLIVYAGLGYGSRWLNWSNANNTTYRISDNSHKGIEFETGIVIKMINWYINLGAQGDPSNEYLEFDLGIGINFSNLKRKK